MFNRIRIPAILVATLATVIGARTAAVADPLPAVYETTEMMMEMLGADMQGIARTYGVDEEADLAFTTFTDPDALAFSYSMDDGVVYQGVPLTLGGIGAYNSESSCWEGQTLISDGQRTTWTTTWTTEVLSVDPFRFHSDWAIADGSRFWGLDFHIADGSITWDQNGINSRGVGWLTVLGIRIPGTTVAVADHVGIPSWILPWNWFADVRQPAEYGASFLAEVDGLSPYDGGFGEANGSFAAVPEPATIALLASGGLVLLRRRRVG